MLWLEMSRDEEHGGGDWGFTKTLWAPSRKRDGTKWAFWESLRDVREGDLVLDLRGIEEEAKFIGFSTATSDGYETLERPPVEGEWAFAKSFLKVDLGHFVRFESPIFLRRLFAERASELITYFENNKNHAAVKRHVFYVVQNSRLQCLNGAYLSEVDSKLREIIFREFSPKQRVTKTTQIFETHVDSVVRELFVRVGQHEFSEKVKEGFGNQCCFPSCTIKEKKFLVGAHIARWADVPELRGRISNGLCFCLMHDRAFELGYFSVDHEFRILINRKNIMVLESEWCRTALFPYEKQKIALGYAPPSLEALKHHWKRIGLDNI